MVYLRSVATSVVLCTLVLLAFPPSRAQAYLDPGTGSYLIQVLIAGLLAATLAVKAFWGKIGPLLQSLLSRVKPSSLPSEQARQGGADES